MRRSKHLFGLAIASASLVAGTTVASAEGDEEQRTGISVVAAGGMEDFAGHTMRETSNLNGMWGIRTAVEVQKYVALEAGYTGSASRVNAPLGNEASTLLGSTFEAIGRLSPAPDSIVMPYAFVGAAWRHYDVSGDDFTTSDSGMADKDDVFQMPVGAGVQYRVGGFIADARFTYRPTVGEDLVLESDGEAATLDSWGMSGGIGYEF